MLLAEKATFRSLRLLKKTEAGEILLWYILMWCNIDNIVQASLIGWEQHSIYLNFNKDTTILLNWMPSDNKSI